MSEEESVRALLRKHEAALWEKFTGDKAVATSSLAEPLIRRLADGISTGIAYAAHLREGMNDGLSGAVVVERSPWDTEHFGLRVGRFGLALFDSGVKIAERASLFTKVLEGLDFDMVSARISMRDRLTAQALEQRGAILTDVLETFRNEARSGGPPHLQQEVEIGTATSSDEKQLVELGRSVFTIDRFHCDPNLPKEKSDELYAKWVSNSLHGFADTVLVAKSGTEVVGFITCKVERIPNNQKYGVIDLVAVKQSFGGEGIGSAVVNAALNWFDDRVDSVYVGTQAANTRAVRLYERNGFRHVSSEATLHLWPNLKA